MTSKRLLCRTKLEVFSATSPASPAATSGGQNIAGSHSPPAGIDGYETAIGIRAGSNYILAVTNGDTNIYPMHSLDPLGVAIQRWLDEGDDAAGQTIWRWVFSQMRRLGLDEETAKDATQKTLVIIWKNWGKYHPAKGTASGWVWGIAKNCCRDERRRVGRHPLEPLDSDDFRPDFEDLLSNAASSIKAKELADAILAHQSLTPEERQHADLRGCRRLDSVVVADVMGFPIIQENGRPGSPNERQAWFRLRKKLQRLFDDLC